ncbi:hypothetical protein SETIT_3G275700v2 [Setaria italica]|uniref:Uncharacterized protein n=1 Tax=Setaria italica TaxID=4555 RepID=A0A368QLH9_SETIT|nr:hypothetical protein SETIT_3G275700v2 [Setaria italica]
METQHGRSSWVRQEPAPRPTRLGPGDWSMRARAQRPAERDRVEKTKRETVGRARAGVHRRHRASAAGCAGVRDCRFTSSTPPRPPVPPVRRPNGTHVQSFAWLFAPV